MLQHSFIDDGELVKREIQYFEFRYSIVQRIVVDVLQLVTANI